MSIFIKKCETILNLNRHRVTTLILGMMKTMNKKTIFNISFILATLILTTNLFAANNEEDIVFEITDRYKEVKLGITETSIYMVIDERIRSLVNLELQTQYEKDLADFIDSDGGMIPGVHTYLSTNRIEIPFSDLHSLDFRNGTLRFNYSKNILIPLEDVISLNGNKALDNFYVEDLEEFYMILSEES